MQLKDRTFIISGGASGLGRATAAEFISGGANVAILDRNTDLGAETIKELGPKNAQFFQCDVTETESIAKAVGGALKWISETGKELGGVIPAAGIGAPEKMLNRDGSPLNLDTFDFVIKVNLRGTIDLLRHTLPHLAKVQPVGPDGERGVVIMVSSSAAFDGQPGQVAYSASKGAIRSMTLPLTRDLARYGIRVVTIAPSLFKSGMTVHMPDKARKSLERAMEFPRREGEGKEFALMCRSVVENIMLNGTTIRLDGGMRMPSKL